MGTHTRNTRLGTGSVMWLYFMKMKDIVLTGMLIIIQCPAGSLAGLPRPDIQVASSGPPILPVTQENPSFSVFSHTNTLSATQERSTVFSKTRLRTTKEIPTPGGGPDMETTIPNMSTGVSDIQTSKKESTLFQPFPTGKETVSSATQVPVLSTNDKSSVPPLSTKGRPITTTMTTTTTTMTPTMTTTMTTFTMTTITSTTK